MHAKLDEQVTACMRDAEAQGSSREIPVIVTLRKVEDLQALRDHGLQVRHVFAPIAAVSGRVQTSQIERLASLVAVLRIEYDGQMHALESD